MAFVNKKYPAASGRNVVFFAIVSLICFLLSSSVLPFLTYDKGLPTPDILLCLVCVISLYVDRKTACIFALVLGFLSDLFINEPVSFSPVIFVASLLVMTMLGKHFSRLGTLSASVCMLPVFVIRMIADTVCFLVRFEESELLEVLTKQTLPSVLVNFAAAIVLTFIIRFVSKRFSVFIN